MYLTVLFKSTNNLLNLPDIVEGSFNKYSKSLISNSISYVSLLVNSLLLLKSNYFNMLQSLFFVNFTILKSTHIPFLSGCINLMRVI